MDWTELLRTDGVTVVGLLIVAVLVVGGIYIRLLNRFIKSLEEENAALNAAILRRDQDDRGVVREMSQKLAELVYRLDHADRDRDAIRQGVDLLLRLSGREAERGVE